ncbi:hypothetical protein AB0A63_19030 [Lentzea sp. NPDC042327]|uniref:hypothetical protein n=1 Tax=Lentzea sp. NPDC042327 TaxID=3154801 RepID=UPI0034104340
MTDRRRTAALLVVLGGALAGAGATRDVFVETEVSQQIVITSTTSLWGTRSSAPSPLPDGGVFSEGLPIVVAAVLMVVAVVCTLREGRTAAVARPAVLVAAGVFAGLVLTFAVGVLRRAELANALIASSPWHYEQHLLPGFPLLVAAAVAGLAGAVLAQRPAPEPEPLGADDDTPPFGIAVGQQEAR